MGYLKVSKKSAFKKYKDSGLKYNYIYKNFDELVAHNSFYFENNKSYMLTVKKFYHTYENIKVDVINDVIHVNY